VAIFSISTVRDAQYNPPASLTRGAYQTLCW